MYKLILLAILVFSILGCSNEHTNNSVAKNNNANKIIKEVKIQKEEIVKAEELVKENKLTEAMGVLEKLKETDRDAKTLYYYAWIKRDSSKWEKEVIAYDQMVDVLSDNYSGSLSSEIKNYKKEFKEKQNKKFEVKKSSELIFVEGVCNDVFKYDVRDVSVFFTADDELCILIKTDAISDSFTDNTLRISNLQRNIDAFDRIYHSMYTINYITIINYIDAVDKYGRNRDAVLMKCTLRNKTAREINWLAKDSVKWESVLDEYRDNIGK